MKTTNFKNIQIEVIYSEMYGKYNPRINQIFGDEKATYAFENRGSGFRLLRFKGTSRSHDLIMTKEENWLDSSNISGGCYLKFDNLVKFIQSLPAVYANYDRPNISDKYYPKGDQMSHKEIEEFILTNLK